MKPTTVDRPPTRVPTRWTPRLQLLTAVVSVLTTIGTAIVLGYVTPEVIQANSPDLSSAEINRFLTGFRAVGLLFLAANAVGILALWGKAWIFYFVLTLDVIQGIGFLVFDRGAAGLRDLANIASIVTDGGGGLLAVVLLGFLIRYHTAWAQQKVTP
jgi:hypothetical protein